MAKRRAPGKTSNRRRARTALDASERARREVQKLLTRSRSGTITQVQLESGLREVRGYLSPMLQMIRYFL
jgi:hypothetical protein